MKFVRVGAFLAASLFALCGSVAAKDWSETTNKGLAIFEWKARTTRLLLVCDPDGVFDPPQIYFMATINGRRAESGVIHLESGGKSTDLSVVGAAVLAKDAPSKWNNAIDMLFGGKPVGITNGGISIEMSGEGDSSKCKVDKGT